jgi:hypothetical protein
LDRPSNRDECSLAFETPDNTGNEQRGILGSALLEEDYVLRCLSALCADDACFLRERTRDDDRNASDHRDYAITTVAKCGGQDMRLPLTI